MRHEFFSSSIEWVKIVVKGKKPRASVRSVEERNAIVVDNLPLIAWATRKWWNKLNRKTQLRYPQDEAYTDAALGLIRAAELWRPEQGALVTIAWWHMRSAMQRGMRTSTIIRVPGSKEYIECGDILYEDGNEVVVGKDKRGEETIDPLDAVDLHNKLARVMGSLPDRWRVCVRRKSEGATLQEIGEELGLSRERVRQILEKAHERLRESLGKPIEDYLLGAV